MMVLGRMAHADRRLRDLLSFRFHKFSHDPTPFDVVDIKWKEPFRPPFSVFRPPSTEVQKGSEEKKVKNFDHFMGILSGRIVKNLHSSHNYTSITTRWL